MEKYDPAKIEPKWQKKWERSGIYNAEDFSSKPKYYCLIEFPYPSGEGLHVGHLRSHIAIDIVARKKRASGYNVMYPIGWDAFGLPTENFAIKTKTHPKIVTEKNIKNFTRQIKSYGPSFDWSREINTTDPGYYKWTQWIFLKLFNSFYDDASDKARPIGELEIPENLSEEEKREHVDSRRLAYEAEMSINWCPKCKIGLANEEVVAGNCERCGTKAGKKIMKQWMLRITKYAERLIKDLDTVDYLEKIKTQQINWIGRSEGAEVEFGIKNHESRVKVYTTRLDTIFGCTYLVVAPEHKIIEEFKDKIENYLEVEKYINTAKNKSDLDRADLAKEKTGVEIKGIKAINSFTNEEVSIWVADYVLGSYGTGAVMAVPAHDERDFEFAKKYRLLIKEVVKPNDKKIPLNPPLRKRETNENSPFEKGGQGDLSKNAFIEDGVLVNSGKYNGLTSAKAREEMAKWLEKEGIGKRKVNYKLRDWVFSRQHYWGEPIPIIKCPKCGNIAMEENKLPLKLPDVKKYEPTDTGESPLANIKEWVNVKCPKCRGAAKRETDTMPNWAGSSWYFLRYTDPKNNKEFASRKKIEYWMPIDLYNGGMEHTTLHLLYSRFWHKFLFDLDYVNTAEPYKMRRSHGMVLAEDGQKMSKSRGNVVNPDEVIKRHGADTVRLYEMFMGPYGDAIPWNTDSLLGMKRFLDRIWQLNDKCQMTNVKSISNDKISAYGGSAEGGQNSKLERIIHQTIKKVSDDIENFKFNTAISALMILANEFEKQESLPREHYEKFLVLLSPFAPHITEELWSELGNKESIFLSRWPKHDPELVKEEEIDLVVQVNGKLRDKIRLATDVSEEEAKKAAMESEKVKKAIDNKPIKKVIFVKGKLVNIVI